MVATPRLSSALVGLGVQLGGQLVLQPLGAQLDRRQRVLDLVRQPACHLGPGHAALRRDDLGDVVEHQQPRITGQAGAAQQQVQGLAAARALAQAMASPQLQLEGVLPVVTLAGLGAGAVQLEALLPHRGREVGQARHLGQRAPAVGD
jgi:hypothetical protein